jgi:hypothetical protein
MSGNPLVIATGGLADCVVRETDVVDVTDPDLTLHGLRLIHELNQDAAMVTRADAERDLRRVRASPRPRVARQ